MKDLQREAVEGIMRTYNVDVSSLFLQQTKRACILILKGLEGDRMIRLDTVIDDTIMLLTGRGMEKTEAQRLIADIATMGCKNLKQVIRNVGDEPQHRRFLRLLEERGNESTRKAAMEELHGKISEPPGKLLRLRIPASRKPLRPRMRQ
jgi:hypothetical protein